MNKIEKTVRRILENFSEYDTMRNFTAKEILEELDDDKPDTMRWMYE